MTAPFVADIAGAANGIDRQSIVTCLVSHNSEALFKTYFST
jgi:hypothetical protein